MPRNTKQVLYEALTTIPIDQSITSGLGTVTSVSMTAPSFLNVSGSPITTSGSLGLTLTTQTANRVLAGPTSGGAATPTFRALVAADIPSLSGTYQPLDATLTALAGLTIAADSLTIGTGADAFNQTTFAANTFPARASTGSLVAKTITDFALTILDDADAASVRATIGAGTGGGSVTSVSVTTANGVSGSVATATTTPAITLTLGAITPSSVASVGAVTGANLSGTNTGDQTSIVGITGTKAQFDTAVTDGNILYVGDAPTAHAASHKLGGSDVILLNEFGNPTASVEFNQQQALQFRLENRTSDPGSPAVGQMWLRTDI